MGFLPGLLLAVLACAAADAALARWAHPHRPSDWLLPAQMLLLWGGWALLVCLPARATARRLGAGLSASLPWLAGPVVLHGIVAARLRSGHALLDAVTVSWLVVALAGLVLAALLLARAERRLAGRRWPRLALAALALLVLVPLRGGAVATSSLPVASPDQRPNLLLLVWDTTRSDHVLPGGYDRPTTPHLAELAASSTLYRNAWSASVFTLSSHVSMLTGLPPSRHGTTLRSQAASAPNVAAALAAAGYRTGAFVGTSVLAAGRGLERGFDVYDDLVDPPVCDGRLWRLVHDAQALLASRVPGLARNGRPHWWQDFERPADEVLAHALDWIRRDDGRPWFALVNLYDAHWPYLPGAAALGNFARPYSGPLGGYLFRADDWPAGRVPDAADRAHAADLYDAELWDLDRAVSGFLGQLDLRAGNLCIVMTSDHGEGLGERDAWSHEDLFAPQTRVPLLLHAPGRAAAGAVDERPASGIDVAPTLLDLAGLPATIADAHGGVSLLAEPPAHRMVFVQDHDSLNRARIEDLVVRDGLLLLRREGKETLHDAAADPLSETDIAAAHPAERADLARALDELLESAREPGADGLDPDNLDALRALGYGGR